MVRSRRDVVVLVVVVLVVVVAVVVVAVVVVCACGWVCVCESVCVCVCVVVVCVSVCCERGRVSERARVGGRKRESVIGGGESEIQMRVTWANENSHPMFCGRSSLNTLCHDCLNEIRPTFCLGLAVSEVVEMFGRTKCRPGLELVWCVHAHDSIPALSKGSTARFSVVSSPL